MNDIKQIKLTHYTAKGNAIRSPALIEFKNGRIYFVKSPFALKDEIKAMKGAKWHGFDDVPLKQWSIEDCPRNRFNLGYMQGLDVYAWFDRDLKRHEYIRPLLDHQRDLADAGLTYHYQIFAAEMGCVDGEAIVHVNRAGRGFTTSLKNLYYKFHNGTTRGRRWDLSIPTYIRSLCGAELRLNQVVNVLDKGVRPVFKVTLVSGKQLRVTADHELCVDYGQYRRADQLVVGDTVLSNGAQVDKGGLVQFVPIRDTVASIEADGKAHVYDVVCADPYRNFVANGIVVHNCGKTLAAQEVIERSGFTNWWWVGPKTSLPNIKREFRKWGFPSDAFDVEMMTYERLTRLMDNWKPGDPIPGGVVFDESSRLKTPTAQRTKAAQMLADLIREKHGYDGYVILMSGTPSPKSPTDWWAQAEVAWPGFLKEGSVKALERRLAVMQPETFDSGVTVNRRVCWLDDERKCAVCGGQPEDEQHTELCEDPDDYHPYQPSQNEVAYLHERLRGLVIVKHKKDCLSLPEKRYRRVYCKPSASTLRAAQAVVQAAPNTVTGLTLLRELSDGFQYRDQADGFTRCTHCRDGMVDEWIDPENPDASYEAIDMLDPELVERLEKQEATCPLCGGEGEVTQYTRITREVPCPKDNALKMLLEENEEVGRLVVFAGFTGSVDRIVKLCQSEGWDVVKCDGRGFAAITHDGASTEEEPLDYWSNTEAHPRVAFVAHPESGGMSLTLTEARMVVYWSNSWKPEYRIQSEDRIHRKGMDENLGCVIVDLIHLPSDERVLDVIHANRKLELMTMGEIMSEVNWDDPRGAEEGFEIEESTS